MDGSAPLQVRYPQRDTEFNFKLSKTSVPRGKRVFTFVNKGNLAHDFWISGKKTSRLSPGKTAKLTITLKAGKYLYVCTVPGHAAAGTYMVGCALLGIDLRVASPSSLWPDPVLLEYLQALAGATKGRLTITENLEAAALGVDAIATEAWVSRSEPVATWGERIALLRPYRVDSRAMAMPHPDVRFLHRLPSFRAADTVVGREIFERYGLTELEVTDEVFESSASVVFDEAENRLHTIKAVMVATLTS